MKRKITTLLLLLTGILLGYLSFTTWAVGFLIARYLGSKTVGKPSKLRSYIIPVGQYKIHLHHWILSAHAIMLFVLLKGANILPPDLFYGFFGSIIFHGIYYYSDWHKIFIPKHERSSIATNELAIGGSIQTPRQIENSPPST